MLKDKEISVIGAGVAGLAAACALAQKGARVRVFERAAALENVGAGIQLSPNGCAVLSALGIDYRKLGPASDAVVLKDFKHGHDVIRLDLTTGRWNHGFVLAHRARLIDALRQRAERAGAEILLGQSSNAASMGGALILGADGIQSQTRAALNGAQDPIFTGQVAWRAIVPDDAPAEAQVYMAPGKHLVTYPLGEGLRNIVAIEERDDWAEEGWNHPDDPENLRRSFAEFCPDVQNWLSKLAEVNLWGLFQHPVAQTWHDGKIALVGDAAHPTLPFLAQGANLALEDAWVLADCLQNLPQPDALAKYQSMRVPRVSKAIAAANSNATNYHLRGAKRFVAHAALRSLNALAPSVMLKRFDWLYAMDVTKG